MAKAKPDCFTENKSCLQTIICSDTTRSKGFPKTGKTDIERLHFKMRAQKLLDNHFIQPYLGAISMGAIRANVTLLAL